MVMVVAVLELDLTLESVVGHCKPTWLARESQTCTFCGGFKSSARKEMAVICGILMSMRLPQNVFLKLVLTLYQTLDRTSWLLI